MTSPEALYVTCYRLETVVIPTQKAARATDPRTDDLNLTARHEIAASGMDRVRGIGERLAAARLAAGLTLVDVGATTRIRVQRLIEFESDDYSGCGAVVFARGRLHTLARTVGLDPLPLLAAFDAAHEPSDLPQRASAQEPAAAMNSRWPLLVMAAVGAVSLYLVVLMVAWVLGGT